MFVRLLRVPVFDLQTGVDQVQHPEHVVEQQTQVVVQLDPLLDGKVEAALNVDEECQEDKDAQFDYEGVLSPIVSNPRVASLLILVGLARSVEHALNHHQAKKPEK